MLCWLAVQQYGLALQYADISFKTDRDVVLAAVRQNGYALKLADDSLKQDKDVVLAANRVSNNSDLMLRAIKNKVQTLRSNTNTLDLNDTCLSRASTALRTDVKFILGVINICSTSECPTIISDEDFILNAVKIDHNNLKYAPEEWRKNKDFMFKAFKTNLATLCYAHKDLLDDEDFIAECFSANRQIFDYVHPEIMAKHADRLRKLHIGHLLCVRITDAFSHRWREPLSQVFHAALPETTRSLQEIGNRSCTQWHTQSNDLLKQYKGFLRNIGHLLRVKFVKKHDCLQTQVMDPLQEIGNLWRLRITDALSHLARPLPNPSE